METAKDWRELNYLVKYGLADRSEIIEWFRMTTLGVTPICYIVFFVLQTMGILIWSP